MSTVFISYRQTDEVERQRVRAFAERLRDRGVDVVLDQFFLDQNPGGPNEGWDKWSSDKALKTEYVLIVGTEAWFQCFDKTQPPGTGLGAACEADDLRHRVYKANGVVSSIRIVSFDDADGAHVPGKLERYHRFHAQRDFANIARWLGGRSPETTVSSPATSIPHNLPSLQPFFGRDEELRKIADALDPESRTWGALIDGPGGMGKTSLAVRAAYDAPPGAFEQIAFVSLKSRELDDDGVRDESGFLISGLAELFNELARQLGHPDIAKASEEQRPRQLLAALHGTRKLLLLDNLESLVKSDRDTVFALVKRLPSGCKAILTSRRRIGSGAEELILEKLSEPAALETLAKLAESNRALAKTTVAERVTLYEETGGKPLLLRWTAGQIGRGSCLTIAHAIDYLRSCPDKNDPLEFVFGDLVEDFTESETQVLCALTYFTLPARLEHVVAIVGDDDQLVDRALRSLINRSLIVPSDELTTFTLVPLVADFLRTKRPEEVSRVGEKLEARAYTLVGENANRAYHRFPVLDAAWAIVAAALPRLLAGPNDRLQTLCHSLRDFLDFSGRWDEWLMLARDAENRATRAGDAKSAGWRALDVGWVHFLRHEAEPFMACVDRAEVHWGGDGAGRRERAIVLRRRGLGHSLAGDYPAAIAALRGALEVWRSMGAETRDVVIGLTALADAERQSGDKDGAERSYRESLRIARAIGNPELIGGISGNLASLAIDRGDFEGAEALAREALSSAENLGKQESIAVNAARLAAALLRQGKKQEALPHASRAVVLHAQLRHPELDLARKLVAECAGET